MDGTFNFYRPKRSFGQGNIFTRVCDSVHGGAGGGAPDFALIFRGGAPDFALIFRGGGVLHRNTVNVRPVRILLECILVRLMFSLKGN